MDKGLAARLNGRKGGPRTGRSDQEETRRMSRHNTRLYGPNKFKLGLFAMNCSNGLTMTKASR